MDAGDDDDEAALFRDAMRSVTPLVKSNKIVPPSDNRAVFLHLAQPNKEFNSSAPDSDQFFQQIATGDDWSFLRSGMSRHTLRRLRRGCWKIQAHLDLHGFTRDEALLELVAFVDACQHNNFRCVCVIHGKGLGSKNHEPVLKFLVGNWLIQKKNVLAFCQARPENGGGGAVIVLLKASSK